MENCKALIYTREYEVCEHIVCIAFGTVILQLVRRFTLYNFLLSTITFSVSPLPPHSSSILTLLYTVVFPITPSHKIDSRLLKLPVLWL